MRLTRADAVQVRGKLQPREGPSEEGREKHRRTVVRGMRRGMWPSIPRVCARAFESVTREYVQRRCLRVNGGVESDIFFGVFNWLCRMRFGDDVQ